MKKYTSQINSYLGHFIHAESFGLRRQIISNSIVKLYKVSVLVCGLLIDDLVILGDNEGELKTIISKHIQLFSLFFLLLFFGLPGFVRADYFKTGSLVSVNLLNGLTNVGAITNFSANSATSSATSIGVQFSRNQLVWYNHLGSAYATDTLSNGVTSFDLSALNWNGPLFYYRLVFATTDVSQTATVDSVNVTYNQSSSFQNLYATSGSLVSTNLLNGLTNVGAITNFSATVSIPAGTSASVQFSRNQLVWYNHLGSAYATDALADGSNSLDLSALGWNGPIFYYRLILTTTDAVKTATADSVSITYSQSSSPSYNYFNQGTFVSANLIPATASSTSKSINKFGYNISSLPAGTSITVQFSNDNTNWYNAGGTLWASTTLSIGSHIDEGSAMDISALGWTATSFYYKINMQTADTSLSPILKMIMLYYGSSGLGPRSQIPDVKLRSGSSSSATTSVKIRGKGVVR